jgi:RNA polymerase subunit RPABC4/transcription elongation factor Spt4
MGKCAWCGAYVPDSADKQALKNFGDIMGFGGIVGKAAGALIPQYCSKRCRLAAAEAKDSGGGGADEAATHANAEAAKAEAEAAKAAAEAAEAEINAEKQAALDAKVKAGHEAVAAVVFGEDAASISTGLSNLLTIATQFDPKTEYYFTDQKAIKSVRMAALDKMEMGIMLLRNKGDAAQADFFQSKMQEKKEEGSLTGKIKAAKDMASGIAGAAKGIASGATGSAKGLFGMLKKGIESAQGQNPAATAQASGGLVCACGAAIAPGAKFCPQCGAPAPAPQVGPAFCVNCGVKLEGAKFCPNCGSPAA